MGKGRRFKVRSSDPEPDPFVLNVDAQASGFRRNVYVSATERLIWEKAQKLVQPDSISSVVTAALRRFVEQKEAAKERIVVEVTDEQGNRIRKGFKGRMLVTAYANRFNAAQGANGGLALWAVEQAGDVRFFETHESWDALLEANKTGPEDDNWPEDFLSVISSALGEGYVEDIDL